MAGGIDSTSHWGSDIGALWKQATTDIPEKEKKKAMNPSHIVEEWKLSWWGSCIKSLGEIFSTVEHDF